MQTEPPLILLEESFPAYLRMTTDISIPLKLQLPPGYLYSAAGDQRPVHESATHNPETSAMFQLSE